MKPFGPPTRKRNLAQPLPVSNPLDPVAYSAPSKHAGGLGVGLSGMNKVSAIVLSTATAKIKQLNTS